LLIIDHQCFIEKTKDESCKRRYDCDGLQSFSEIWKYQDERGQEFITVSTVSLYSKLL